MRKISSNVLSSVCCVRLLRAFVALCVIIGPGKGCVVCVKLPTSLYAYARVRCCMSTLTSTYDGRKERLAKVIARSGVASRRAAEKLIEEVHNTHART